jgi:hypothetical protein
VGLLQQPLGHWSAVAKKGGSKISMQVVLRASKKTSEPYAAVFPAGITAAEIAIASAMTDVQNLMMNFNAADVFVDHFQYLYGTKSSE